MSYLREKLPEFSPAVVEMEPWRKALMDAAELIRTGGHCKSALERGDAHCAAGAIFRVVSGSAFTPGPRTSAVIAAFEKHISANIVLWNNAAERTAAEVIAAFEGAARS